MKFFNIGKNKKKEDNESYLFGLVLSQDEGTGLLIKKGPGDAIEILEKRDFHFSSGWENIIYDVDEVLFALETERNIKLEEAVYFVYAHLVDTHTKEIKNAYAEALKQISKENSLKPVGYFEYNELIPAYLQAKEDNKLNAMLIEIDSPAITLSIYKSGKMMASESTAKTQNLVEDVESLLTKLKNDEILPTRIIMYDSSKLQDESHVLLTHKWPKELFIQIPKIEVLSDGEVTNVLKYGLEKQMFKHPSHITFSNDASEENAASDTQETIPDEADDVQNESEIESTSSDSPSLSSVASGAVAGFVVGEDILEKEQPTQDVLEPVATAVTSSVPLEKVSENQITSKKFTMPRISIPKMPSFGQKKLLVPGIVGGIALVIIGLIVSTLYFFHTATLTILYQPQEISEEILIEDLSVSEQSENFKETASTTTTGSKSIGEKASGEITIFNALDEELSLGEGVEFAADNLVFTLSKAVSAEPGTTKVTGDGDILTTTSKTNASLEASAIGSTYNVKKDTEFLVEGRSKKEAFAKAKSAFTGGSEEEIQAVSSDDYENINDAINVKLDQKAEDAAKKNGEISVIADLTKIDIEDETYSHSIGEEADTLDLSVDANVIFYTFDESELKDVLIKQLQKENKGELVFEKKNVSYEIVEVEEFEDTDKMNLTVDAKATSSFEADEEKVITDVKGKKTNTLRTLLKSGYKAAGYEVTVKTPLPFLQSFLPFFTKNIDVKLEAIK